jgi:UDP-N-acetylmuramate dehydrogenase
MYMTPEIFERIKAVFPNVTSGELLARHSTMRVGGPAGAFLVVRSVVELQQAVSLAHKEGVPFHILGGGSNTLFSDCGFDGLVIKNMASTLTIGNQAEQLEVEDWQAPEVRHEAADPKKYISFLDLDYAERPGDTVVSVESGANLTATCVKTIHAGYIGLEWFGGIPGVIGGAVYNNIHGGTHFIGTRVRSVTAMSPAGEVKTYQAAELDFAYDYSRFHETDEILLSCEFLLTKATGPEIERADYTFREWVKRKSAMQPKEGSMGSTFQNISQQERERIGAPTTAAGWLIDQCGLKGKMNGKAQIAPEHANFIINTGGATAHEVYALMQLAQQSVKQKFGIDLKPEVFLVGEFDAS